MKNKFIQVTCKTITFLKKELFLFNVLYIWMYYSNCIDIVYFCVLRMCLWWWNDCIKYEEMRDIEQVKNNHKICWYVMNTKKKQRHNWCDLEKEQVQFMCFDCCQGFLGCYGNNNGHMIPRLLHWLVVVLLIVVLNWWNDELIN